jgi:hypothetical protein
MNQVGDEAGATYPEFYCGYCNKPARNAYWHKDGTALCIYKGDPNGQVAHPTPEGSIVKARDEAEPYDDGKCHCSALPEALNEVERLREILDRIETYVETEQWFAIERSKVLDMIGEA